jgi:nitrous oxidase accessory protein NosD
MNSIKLGLMILVAVLTGCTFSSISSLPIQTAQGDLYRYEGRANFPYQIAEADQLITEHCAKLNGGKPVVVNVQKHHLGNVSFANASATTTGSAVVTGNTISGSAVTTGYGSGSSIKAFNQVIMFKCERKP